MTAQEPQIKHRAWCDAPHVELFTGRHGDAMARCTNCRDIGVVETTATRTPNADPAPPAAARPRYALACVRCDRVMRVHSARPRVPVCAECSRPGRARKAVSK